MRDGRVKRVVGFAYAISPIGANHVVVEHDSDFDFNYQQYFIETPLGEGDVDFDEYTRALVQIGYSGYLTIEREVGADPVGDIIKARRFLEKYR